MNLPVCVLSRESIIETFMNANSRADSSSDRPRERVKSRATLFQITKTLVLVMTPANNCAVWVSVAVRVALVRDPISFTSLKSVAYRSLVSSGCRGVMNCVIDFIEKGTAAGICDNPGCPPGAAGCHMPGNWGSP